MIDIGILDAHPVVRAGLRRLASQYTDLRVVAEAASPADVIAWVGTLAMPDVLVLDLPHAGQRGLDTIACIRARAPQLAMLVFTAHAAQQYAVEALRQGALGYLDKNCEPDELVVALRTLSMGRRYLSTVVTELLADQIGRGQKGAAHENLSERESQVFYKLAMGETAAATAAALALSVKTVSTYRARLLDKLSLSSNTDLTYYAVNNGLIT